MKKVKTTASGKVDKRSKEYQSMSKLEKKVYNKLEDAFLKLMK